MKEKQPIDWLKVVQLILRILSFGLAHWDKEKK